MKLPAKQNDPSTITVIDQMGNTVCLPTAPQRIVSLVPSQTELLFDLGLATKIVGVTKFCVHPSTKIRSVAKIGGTKSFNFDRIAALQPDLIIGNKEENYKEGIAKLQRDYPVWMSDIYSMEDNLAMIKSLGQLTNRIREAEKMINAICKGLSSLEANDLGTVVYLIWRNPYMAAGGNTYINHMLELCGFNNLLQNKPRYPQLESKALVALQPKIVCLSSEPYPFKEKHKEELSTLLPNTKLILVDGEMFSWYGSRTLKALEYFKSLIHTIG